MRLNLWLAFALAIPLTTAACDAESPTSGPTGRTTNPLTAKGRAIDGDTVSIDIRLFGADAFEKRQLCRNTNGCWPCGKEAQDYASRLLKSGNTTIRLTGNQSYGRPIGTVEVKGQDLGETMIAAGLAVPAVSYLKNDPARASRYVAAYDKAVAAHTGAHRGYFIDPAEWRRGKRLSCETKAKPWNDHQH